jgi:hypothetical protein
VANIVLIRLDTANFYSNTYEIRVFNLVMSGRTIKVSSSSESGLAQAQLMKN